MRLLLDADGLIKLQRAGVLARVAKVFACTIPQAVYREAVVRGKERFHRDAEDIERIVAETVTVAHTLDNPQSELGLGAGETAILAFLVEQGRDFIVVSDDRRFLSILRGQGIQHITPAHLLVMLAWRGVLTRTEALEALERLRPTIRISTYWSVRQHLEKEQTYEE